jgi:RecA-family ATPase
MDRLDKKQRETVIKLSTVRLQAKLAKAGVDEEELENLSREQLLEKWAEKILAGNAAPEESTRVYNIDLERERLQFEKEKFAMELEEKRLAREEAARATAWEHDRLDDEKEERRKVREAEAERAQQQLIQLQLANRLQQEALEKEKHKNESVVEVLKRYGEAIRHSITKMFDNSAELIIFF